MVYLLLIRDGLLSDGCSAVGPSGDGIQHIPGLPPVGTNHGTRWILVVVATVFRLWLWYGKVESVLSISVSWLPQLSLVW